MAIVPFVMAPHPAVINGLIAKSVRGPPTVACYPNVLPNAFAER